ncbi:3',5'-cyclic-nucleotide phosphodiesterase, partial [Haematococcus lacustris]
KEAADKRSVVYGAGLDWAASFQLSFEQFFTPLVTLSIFIKQNPYFPSFALDFQTIANDVVATLCNAPLTAVAQQHSPGNPSVSTGCDCSSVASHLPACRVPHWPALRGGGLDTVASRKLLLNGPLDLLPSAYGAIVRLPIFVQNSTQNETFGTNKSSAWLG